MKKLINIEPEELFNQLIEQQKLNAAQQATILKLSDQLEQLQHRIDKLLQLLYGVKSEKKKRPASSSTDVLVPASQNQENRNPKSSKSNGRRPLPSGLPRVQKVICKRMRIKDMTSFTKMAVSLRWRV